MTDYNITMTLTTDELEDIVEYFKEVDADVEIEEWEKALNECRKRDEGTDSDRVKYPISMDIVTAYKHKDSDKIGNYLKQGIKETKRMAKIEDWYYIFEEIEKDG